MAAQGAYTPYTVPLKPSVAIDVPYLSGTAQMADRLNCLALHLSTMRGKYPDDASLVQTVMSLFLTAVPEAEQSVRGGSTPAVNPVSKSPSEFLGLLDVDRTGAQNPGLLVLGRPAQSSAVAASHETSVYSGVALVVFAIGRQARESAPTAAEINRPKALIGKYTIPEDEQLILPGRTAGPEIPFLERVFNAFAVYSGWRATITRTLLGIRASTIHYPPHIDPLMVQFSLMRDAGLTHVGAIMKLIYAHPWVIRVPELEPYVRIFIRDLRKFDQLPAHGKAYHRLLASPSDYLFLTSDLRPLIAVAGSFVTSVESKFKDYVYKEKDYQDLVNSVRSRMPGYTIGGKLASMAQQFDLDEIPDIPDTILIGQAPQKPVL